MERAGAASEQCLEIPPFRGRKVRSVVVALGGLGLSSAVLKHATFNRAVRLQARLQHHPSHDRHHMVLGCLHRYVHSILHALRER